MKKGYEVVWLPAPGVLFQAPETATGISHHIECQILPLPAPPAAEGSSDAEPEPPPVVTGYRFSLEPEPPAPAINIAASASGVSVSAPTLAGLFGIDFIDYLQDGKVERITRWDDLPAEADEIIEFRPSRLSERRYRLLVTADLSSGQQEQAGYTIIINQEWTAGRNRLKEEVNARSNKTR